MKKRVCLAVLISLAMILAIASPVFAIVNPTSITLHTARVFQNIFQTGDMLFMMRYDINTTDNVTTFPDGYLVNLINTDGTTLLLSRQIAYFQHNTISIYATAAQVITFGLTMTGTPAYLLRVTGNPALFGATTEGLNMATRTLAPTDYNPDGVLHTSKELLRQHCIDIAEELEFDWGLVLLATTTTNSQVLNSTGSVTFLAAVPGLNSAIPSLFQLSSLVPVVPQVTSNATYAVESQLDLRMGPAIGEAFTGIGTFLGVGQSSAAGAWAIIFILTIMSIAFLNTGNSLMGLVLAVPIVVLMTYLGAIPDAITYVLAILVVLYSMYFFWLRGT